MKLILRFDVIVLTMRLQLPPVSVMNHPPIDRSFDEQPYPSVHVFAHHHVGGSPHPITKDIEVCVESVVGATESIHHVLATNEWDEVCLYSEHGDRINVDSLLCSIARNKSIRRVRPSQVQCNPFLLLVILEKVEIVNLDGEVLEGYHPRT